MYLFTKKILAGEPIPVYNKGKMKRDFTYIDDIISGTRAAIRKNYKCEIFNLGNHKSENLMDLVHLIENGLGKKALIDFLPMQQGDVKISFADIQNSIDMLGYEPKTSIKDGIPQFLKWYKKHNNYS